MTKPSLDTEVRDYLKHNAEPIPDSVNLKIEGALNALATRKSIRTRVIFNRKKLLPLFACMLLLALSATAYAALTDKYQYAIFKDRGQTVVFANGTSLHYEIDKNHTTVMGGDSKGPWVVKESWGRLLVSVNGEKINITKVLKEKGYFYYDYRDNANILHRLYIVKNAGGTKDYAERWYSQQEWLPELGMGGGQRGISGPLAEALLSADLDATKDGKNLDAMLKKHLEKYWAEYGE
jgi:hypothetical protein